MRRRKKSLRVRPRGLAGTTGIRRDEECYRRALEACRARRRATELPASHELCLLELPAIAQQYKTAAREKHTSRT